MMMSKRGKELREGMIIWLRPEAEVAFITRPQLESYGHLLATKTGAAKAELRRRGRADCSGV